MNKDNLLPSFQTLSYIWVFWRHRPRKTNYYYYYYYYYCRYDIFNCNWVDTRWQ